MTPDPRLAVCRARLDEMQRDAEAATALWETGVSVWLGHMWDGHARHVETWPPSVALSTITLLRGLLDRTAGRLGRHQRAVTLLHCRWDGDTWPCLGHIDALADLDALSGQLGVSR